jgi:UDPglucose 6-dehydrogenase
MKITIIGSGYVGLVTAVCFAEMGNDVFCLDLDEGRIQMLKNNNIPIYEPGLDEMVISNARLGRLHFSSDVKASVDHGEIQFIAVGTPQDEDGAADLSYVLKAAKNIGQFMSSTKIVVNKSTVPIGTADKVKAVIHAELKERNVDCDFSVVSNPEFLKEGTAIDDFMKPDRILIGHDSSDSGMNAKEVMEKIYSPFNRNHHRIIFMDVRSAELAKYAANAMLATRISFMNELANLSDKVGADIEMVRQGIGSDKRIGYDFLYAGTGYGGSCFPKDVKALIQTAKEYEQDAKILISVDAVNDKQKFVLVDKLKNEIGFNLKDKKIAVWGLSFKPNTDDMREAPSRIIIRELLSAGAVVQVHDPVAKNEAIHAFRRDFEPHLLKNVLFLDEPLEACQGVDALILVTEWKLYRSPDFEYLQKIMKSPIIFDGRNLYNPVEMKALGFTYFGVGRSTEFV